MPPHVSGPRSALPRRPGTGCAPLDPGSITDMGTGVDFWKFETLASVYGGAQDDPTLYGRRPGGETQGGCAGAGLVQENYPVLGSVTGERLIGKLRGDSFYDWMSGPAGVGNLRVIATIETDDGAVIDVRYEGRADITNGLENVLGYASPVFTATDPEYLWLNLAQTVARGTIHGDRIHWDWYHVAEQA